MRVDARPELRLVGVWGKHASDLVIEEVADLLGEVVPERLVDFGEERHGVAVLVEHGLRSRHRRAVAALLKLVGIDLDANLRRAEIGKALVYSGEVDVGDAGTRRLALIFPGPPSRVPPIVMADGSRKSRHRYRWSRPTSLCIWYSNDPLPQRWTIQEGLHGLIDRARVHLLKEAWWRVHGHWPSPKSTTSRAAPSDGSPAASTAASSALTASGVGADASAMRPATAPSTPRPNCAS